MQGSGTWEGYLVAAAASKQTLGSSSVAQDLLRKRYLGISGSNKVVGAMEVQQVKARWRCCFYCNTGSSGGTSYVTCYPRSCDCCVCIVRACSGKPRSIQTCCKVVQCCIFTEGHSAYGNSAAAKLTCEQNSNTCPVFCRRCGRRCALLHASSSSTPPAVLAQVSPTFCCKRCHARANVAFWLNCGHVRGCLAPNALRPHSTKQHFSGPLATSSVS